MLSRIVHGLSWKSEKPVSSAIVILMSLLSLVFLLPQTSYGQAKKPNILVIFGDDIGQANISRYTHGVVGYMTPNIDRVGAEGMTFTDYYAENSCTAGRSSFITGQSPMRVGLTKVGAPGATVGIQKRDITIAEASRWGMPPANSARTILATAMNFYQPTTASMSSSAICTT
jgi:hypothetical protein